MDLGEKEKANALYDALANMGMDVDLVRRAQAESATLQISAIGLDSKDLLALDFQLEEDHGLNIQFNDVRDDMTIDEFLDHISKTDP